MSVSNSSSAGASPRIITIIGAGIAGLTLANLLQRANINFSIYEARTANTIGHNYAITLSRKPWRKLVNRFSEKHSAFRQETAADRFVGGNGKVFDQSPQDAAVFQAIDRDVRLWLIQRLKEKGAEIKWGYKLSRISAASNNHGASVDFEGKDSIHSDIIIDAAGLRSPAFDNQVADPPRPKLLPYATFYGTRRISTKDFDNRFAHYFRSGNKICYSSTSPGTPFIQIKKSHLPASDGGEDFVELQWVYSRPAREGFDPLYRPNRTPEEAKNIPEEFYVEFESVITQISSEKQRSMFKAFFNLSDLHKDRILNWHLRLRLPPSDYFIDNTTSQQCHIIAIGDAAHGLPIVESKGADYAASDALDLLRWLEAPRSDEGKFARDENFYKRPNVHRNWFKHAVESVERLRMCHGESELTAVELEEMLGYWPDGVEKDRRFSASSGSD